MANKSLFFFINVPDKLIKISALLRWLNLLDLIMCRYDLKSSYKSKHFLLIKYGNAYSTAIL